MGRPVVIVYAAFGAPTEPQMLGVASSASRAEALAERYAAEERLVWRRPDWIEWDSARRVRPAADGRGTAVEVWLVAVGLDESTRFGVEAEPHIDEHDVEDEDND